MQIRCPIFRTIQPKVALGHGSWKIHPYSEDAASLMLGTEEVNPYLEIEDGDCIEAVHCDIEVLEVKAEQKGEREKLEAERSQAKLVAKRKAEKEAKEKAKAENIAKEKLAVEVAAEQRAEKEAKGRDDAETMNERWSREKAETEAADIENLEKCADLNMMTEADNCLPTNEESGLPKGESSWELVLHQDAMNRLKSVFQSDEGENLLQKVSSEDEDGDEVVQDEESPDGRIDLATKEPELLIDDRFDLLTKEAPMRSDCEVETRAGAEDDKNCSNPTENVSICPERVTKNPESSSKSALMKKQQKSFKTAKTVSAIRPRMRKLRRRKSRVKIKVDESFSNLIMDLEDFRLFSNSKVLDAKPVSTLKPCYVRLVRMNNISKDSRQIGRGLEREKDREPGKREARKEEGEMVEKRNRGSGTSEAQREKLMQRFEENNYPGAAEIEEMSKEVGWSKQGVRDWFNYTRKKTTKNEGKSGREGLDEGKVGEKQLTGVSGKEFREDEGGKGVVGEEGVKEIKLRELKVMVTKVPKVITKNFDRIIQGSMQKLEDGQ